MRRNKVKMVEEKKKMKRIWKRDEEFEVEEEGEETLGAALLHQEERKYI